jgi:subfamily B ATP-binding cassette protein MsbA
MRVKGESGQCIRDPILDGRENAGSSLPQARAQNSMRIILFLVPFISFMIKKVGKKIKDLSHTLSCQNADLQSFFYEVFHNIILVKTSVTQKKEVEKINQKLDRIEKNAWHLAKIRAAAHPIVEILGGLAIVTSIMIGGWQVIHQQKTVGSFFSFIISGLFLYPSLKKLAGVRCKIQEGLSSYQRMSDIAQKANVESDHRIVHSQTKFLTSQGNITIKNLCFRYPEYEAKILDNFHCTLSPGCLTVLKGPSGTGKTTLFYILMRLYDPESGTILWGDQNIKDIPIDRLRQNISFVSQNNHLFNESIFYNIAYGTTASRQCVIQAAEKAFAHEFIQKMPGQYDTMIGQNGIQLSGGQRQRIALARAFLRNTPIILLDESTSALDNDCEKKIIQSIHHLKESGKIVVAIAHRPSIINQADQVLSIHSIDTTQSRSVDARK